jgi:A/G-specific adenine glycosylase
LVLNAHNFAAHIIGWYQANKRDLPWRNTQDPYQIWLSEIILQQTRVRQGLPYFIRFLEVFPDVFTLASASESDVLRLWQGLGYYSRARNLHACAQEIVHKYGGRFPGGYADLIKLKGVGAYTAAAIASFAYNEDVAVVDGNVFRVLARVFGVQEDILSPAGQKKFRALAAELLPGGHAGEYNQAIMEFGALQCTPHTPACLLCPISHMCYAFQHSKQKSLPVKIKKLKVKKRFFSYIVIRQGERVYMKMRGKKDIWQGLYDFYLLENSRDSEDILQLEDELVNQLMALEPVIEVSPLRKHQLTHQQLWVRFFAIIVRDGSLADSLLSSYQLQAFTPEEIRGLPKPILIDNYLSEVIF